MSRTARTGITLTSVRRLIPHSTDKVRGGNKIHLKNIRSYRSKLIVVERSATQNQREIKNVFFGLTNVCVLLGVSLGKKPNHLSVDDIGTIDFYVIYYVLHFQHSL